MKTQSLGWLVGLGAMVSAFASCSQPAVQCQVGLAGNNPYAALFTLKGAMPACAAQNPGVVMLGDKIGMEFYNPPSADGTTYDPNSTIVSMELDTVGEKYAYYSQYPGLCQRSSCQPGSCGAIADGCGSDAAGMASGLEVWAAWSGGTTYNAGDEVTNTQPDGTTVDIYVCTSGGTSDSTSGATGPTGTGTGIKDGTAVWSYVGPSGDCGPCPNAGETCGGGGKPGMCGKGQTCTPTTCMALGANCGQIGDGCGGMLNCGTCSGQSFCGGSGTPNVCGFPVYAGASCTTDADCGNAGKCTMSGGMGTCTTTNVRYNLAPKGFASLSPDANNMCQVTVQPAELDVASGPTAAAMGNLPGDTIQYTWSNINVYVTSADQGTEFEADLHYSENGCAVDYHVVGLWPAVDCTDHDAMGNAIPNQDLCNPCAEPDKGRPTGSGISPDYVTTCARIFADTDKFNNANAGIDRSPYWCVPAKPSGIPQLNPNPPTCQ